MARLQALAAKVAPTSDNASTDENGARPDASKPTEATPSPDKLQHPPRELRSSPTKILQSPPPTAKAHRPVSVGTRITPWLIASITLTLALFSGNYAWHTQQQVEKVNLRLDQLETQITTAPTTSLSESNDDFANTEQELLALQQTQGQLKTTVSTLQNALAADTEQMRSRLVTLEDNLAEVISQAQLASLDQTETLDNRKEKPPGTQSISPTAAKEASIGETKNNAIPDTTAANSAEANWFINIASFSDPRTANESYEKVLKIVDKASIKPMSINGKTVYRVRAESYSSLAKAEREVLALQAQLGLSGLWVSRD